MEGETMLLTYKQLLAEGSDTSSKRWEAMGFALACQQFVSKRAGAPVKENNSPRIMKKIRQANAVVELAKQQGHLQ